MAYRKFMATQLFDGYKLHSEPSVLITSPEGIVENIVPPSEAGDDVETYSGILSPGFINCHCHLELSHMKGLLPEKTSLSDFVYGVVSKRHFPESDILNAISRAEDEMLQNGIVAVGDICNNGLTIPQKVKQRIYYHNFIEASGFDPSIADERFERSKTLFREYSAALPGRKSRTTIVPHAPYSVSTVLWQMLIDFPGNQLLTIHNQESADEEELFHAGSGGFIGLYKKMGIDISAFNATGKSSLRSYLLNFRKNQSVILVHNVHTTALDIRFATDTGLSLSWCLCPNANLYIEGQLPAVDVFIQNNVDIVLGTDSLASNHQLSILEEIKTIRKHYPSITNAQFLGWATLNGAKALQMDNLLGSFETGKHPGVILCENDLSGVRRIL